MAMFIRTLFTDPRSFAAMTLIVVFSICVHEYLHAWVALKMGDPTAADRGHLTMNPFKQMGWISLLMLAFLGIAWGQVPVNPDNLPARKARIAVALAGVCGNLLLSAGFLLLAFLTLISAQQQEFALHMLIYGSMINLVLFMLNIMPVPGLDGFLIVREFIHLHSASAMEKANVVFFILMMLLFFSLDHISAAASHVIFSILHLLYSLWGGA